MLLYRIQEKKSSQQQWIITNLQYNVLILISVKLEFKGRKTVFFPLQIMLAVQLMVNFCCFKLQKLTALWTKLKSYAPKRILPENGVNGSFILTHIFIFLQYFMYQNLWSNTVGAEISTSLNKASKAVKQPFCSRILVSTSVNSIT